MPILVNLPDGSQASFPDGTPPETMKAAIQKKFPPQGAQAQPSQAPQRTNQFQKFGHTLETRPDGSLWVVDPGKTPFRTGNVDGGQPTQQPRFGTNGVSDNIEAQPPERPNLLNSTLATVNGLVDAVPGLQQGTDALMGAGGMLMGKDYGETVRGLQARRAELAQSAPFARGSGEVVGSIMAPFGLGSRAAGMTGKFGERVLNSGLSMAGYQGAQSMAHGKGGGEALQQMALGGLGGVVSPFVGAAVEKAGGAVANALTGGAQRKLTSKAIAEGAPNAAELKSAASQMFESATGGNAPAVSAPAYKRFMTNIEQSVAKIRPNAANDPKAVGLLQHLTTLMESANTPGTVVDLKDLHLARQLAQKVAQSSEGRDSAVGSIVINKLDDFIKGLKPADILGGADPKEAANSLMKGISTWHRASKLSTIENAVEQAKFYKSGFENGLRLKFQGLLRDEAFRRQLSKPELQALTDVANGTTKSNLVTLLGKFGFGTGSAGNMTGGTIGATLGGALGSVFGPLGTAAGVGAVGLGAAGMRKLSEKIGEGAAARAAQVVATPNIPVARQIPNILAPARVPIELLVRGGSAAATSR